MKPRFGIALLIAGVWRAFLAAAPVKVWAQIGAAVALTLVLVAGAWKIANGPWISERPGQQLDAMFFLLIGVELLMLVALAAITGLSVNLHGGRDGVTASLDQDEAQPIHVRTVTDTTVTQKPPEPTAATDDGELPPDQRLQP